MVLEFAYRNRRRTPPASRARRALEGIKYRYTINKDGVTIVRPEAGENGGRVIDAMVEHGYHLVASSSIASYRRSVLVTEGALLLLGFLYRHPDPINSGEATEIIRATGKIPDSLHRRTYSAYAEDALDAMFAEGLLYQSEGRYWLTPYGTTTAERFLERR